VNKPINLYYFYSCIHIFYFFLSFFYFSIFLFFYFSFHVPDSGVSEQFLRIFPTLALVNTAQIQPKTIFVYLCSPVSKTKKKSGHWSKPVTRLSFLHACVNCSNNDMLINFSKTGKEGELTWRCCDLEAKLRETVWSCSQLKIQPTAHGGDKLLS